MSKTSYVVMSVIVLTYVGVLTFSLIEMDDRLIKAKAIKTCEDVGLTTTHITVHIQNKKLHGKKLPKYIKVHCNG